MMEKCCYKDCEEDAVVNGIVYARNPEGGKEIPTAVQACEKHKSVPGFFPSDGGDK
ncbi:hypothetical protein [Brevibacillus sp. MER 51]|uniref:hypothetical protein n=1 Tax=Brevibacillus sp. MER 51 TaxID=2939560 RepID=UPI00203CD15E|nr:hypothetical protein [Brevibacillus sp. MER 51]MCM3144339.1 hypothetical protein [Brevibacillus sp. MER 51]